jgi:hypothetical protein
MNWQSIITAPKDSNVWILIAEKTGTWMTIARWIEDGWYEYKAQSIDFQAFWWMPLPPTPQE